MTRNIKVSDEGYAILKATPIEDSNLVVTEACPFCKNHHLHVNPKKDERGDIPLRKSHCVNKTLIGITEAGLAVGNHIYYIEVEDVTRKN